MSYLSDEEMEGLTGAKKPSVQKRVLEENGIFCITRYDDSVTTTWHHVNYPIKYRHQNEDTSVDFSAIK